ncbi:YbaB/EbfC family nucleoid-associated protein [Streptosporangium sp. CA-135522]|uniref:YbaB/EbfC family nucleoid-associated protein n=1 Tax=Streptosporangium sp. CA-135522 TaxID=3240072 RepID=UPI003D8A254F
MKHDPFGGDAGRLAGEIEGWVDTLATTIRELNDQELTGADGSGRVLATVTGSGRVLRVSIAPRAMRELDNVAIAAAIMEAVGAAREAMGESLTKAMETLNGGPGQADLGDDPLAAYFEAVLGEDDHG